MSPRKPSPLFHCCIPQLVRKRPTLALVSLSPFAMPFPGRSTKGSKRRLESPRSPSKRFFLLFRRNDGGLGLAGDYGCSWGCHEQKACVLQVWNQTQLCFIYCNSLRPINAEILLVGTGASMRRPNSTLIESFKRKGIVVEQLTTVRGTVPSRPTECTTADTVSKVLPVYRSNERSVRGCQGRQANVTVC